MSLSYVSNRVMAPSVAPATNDAGASFKLASRRVNLDGQVTAFSPVGETDLPALITPQSYGRPTEYLADQLLLSNDNGATWKLVPGSVKGAQNVPAFDSSWTTVVDLDNQTSVLSNIELGNFGALSNPEATFYVVNSGAGVQSFTYSFIDLISGQVASQYSGLIEITLDGVYSASGSNPSSLYNATLIWSGANSLNTHKLVLAAGQFAKLKVRLINFPTGGFAGQEVNLSLQVVANQTSFTLGFAEQWPNKTFQVDLDNYPYELFEGLNNFSIIVKPFMVNYNGRLLVNWFNRQLNFGASAVERWVAVLDNGNIRAYESEAQVPTNSVLIGRCSTTGSAPWLTGVEYRHDVRPVIWRKGGGSVDKGLFVKLTESELETTSDNNVVGVSLENGLYASYGLVKLVAGETLVKGDLVGPGTGGKAVKSGSYGVVLVGGLTDSFVLVELVRNRVDTSSPTWGSISGTLSAQTDLQSALDAKQPLDSQLTSLAGWTDDQVARAGALPSATNGTLEKTGANSYGTYAVTTAAKSVLDDASVGAMLATLGGAPLASPTFTGVPTVPTAVVGTNNTQIANTAFVNSRNTSDVFGEWVVNNYALGLTSGADTFPTLISPTVYSGSGFFTSGFTVPSGQGGLYYVEVYAEIVANGNNLSSAAVGLRRNTTDYFRRNQLNVSGMLAYINTLGSVMFLNAGDTLRPQIRADFSVGTCQLLNLSFLVHKLPSW